MTVPSLYSAGNGKMLAVVICRADKVRLVKASILCNKLYTSKWYVLLIIQNNTQVTKGKITSS